MDNVVTFAPNVQIANLESRPPNETDISNQSEHKQSINDSTFASLEDLLGSVSLSERELKQVRSELPSLSAILDKYPSPFKVSKLSDYHFDLWCFYWALQDRISTIKRRALKDCVLEVSKVFRDKDSLEDLSTRKYKDILRRIAGNKEDQIDRYKVVADAILAIIASEHVDGGSLVSYGTVSATGDFVVPESPLFFALEEVMTDPNTMKALMLSAKADPTGTQIEKIMGELGLE